ncbi:MAG TPA: hypothetical protein VFW87_08970 [Pirellulales bacterium]|nr:hypothetical protein [Pirellulales bacterium]
MSRLTTVVCALSAIVTIVDYFTAKPLFANWLARQVSHTPDGWQISPALNAAAIAAFAGLVWMTTGCEPAPANPQAKGRLFRTRAYLIGCGLGLWFFFGPSIASPPPLVKTTAPTAASDPAATRPAEQAIVRAAPAARVTGYDRRGIAGRADADSPFGPPKHNVASRGWRPGDGLRMMANLIEGWVNPPTSEPPRIGR